MCSRFYSCTLLVWNEWVCVCAWQYDTETEVRSFRSKRTKDCFFIVRFYMFVTPTNVGFIALNAMKFNSKMIHRNTMKRFVRCCAHNERARKIIKKRTKWTIKGVLRHEQSTLHFISSHFHRQCNMKPHVCAREHERDNLMSRVAFFLVSFHRHRLLFVQLFHLAFTLTAACHSHCNVRYEKCHLFLFLSSLVFAVVLILALPRMQCLWRRQRWWNKWQRKLKAAMILSKWQMRMFS